MRILPQSAQARPIPPQALAQYRYPSEKHLTPTHCGNCGARLIAGDVPTADAPLADLACLLCSRPACVLVHDGMRRPLTPEEWKALPIEQSKRGPKPQEPPALTTRTWPCADCQTARVRRVNARCHACLQTYRTEISGVARLVVALGDGLAVDRVTLMGRLGVTYEGLRKILQRARRQGRPIVNDRQGFLRLGVAR